MGGSELAAVGLSPAHASFRVFGAPDEDGEAELLGQIAFGNADPGRGILARGSGTDVVYRLDYALADEFPVNYGAFLESFASKERREVGDALGAEGELGAKVGL